MPLIQSLLSLNIKNALLQQLNDKAKSSAPLVSQSAADALADAYHNWIISSFPIPPFSFVSPPIKNSLSSQIILPEFEGWGSGMIAYWSPCMITGPGFIPSNPLSPAALALLPANSQILVNSLKSLGLSSSKNKNESISSCADKFASSLFTFTMGLSFLMTTSSPVPVTSILQVA